MGQHQGRIAAAPLLVHHLARLGHHAPLHRLPLRVLLLQIARQLRRLFFLRRRQQINDEARAAQTPRRVEARSDLVPDVGGTQFRPRR